MTPAGATRLLGLPSDATAAQIEERAALSVQLLTKSEKAVTPGLKARYAAAAAEIDRASATLRGTIAGTPLSREAAIHLLGLPAGAGQGEIEDRVQTQRSLLESRILNAPTSGLKAKYRIALSELLEALTALGISAKQVPAPAPESAEESESASTIPSTVELAPIPPLVVPFAHDDSTHAEPPPSPPPTPVEAPTHRISPAAPPAPKTPEPIQSSESSQPITPALPKTDAEADETPPRRSGTGKSRPIGLLLLWCGVSALLVFGVWMLQRNRAEAEFARLRAVHAESRVRWAAVEQDLGLAERRLNELKAEARTIRERTPGDAKEIQAKLFASERYANWLEPFVARHPAKLQMAKLESYLASRATTNALASAQELGGELTAAEREIAEQKKAILAISAPVAIDSSPSGLRFTYTDAYDRTAEGATPFLGELPVGPLQITVKARPGWADYQWSTQVQGAVPLRVQANFAQGTANVNSQPEGLAFTLKNELGYAAQGLTPASVAELPVGRIAVTIKRPGWSDQKNVVEVEAGKSSEVNAAFFAGGLNLVSEPFGAEFMLSNEHGFVWRGKGPAKLTDVPVGVTSLRASHPGWPDQTATIKVEDGTETEHRAFFESGEAEVTSAPPGLRFEFSNPHGYRHTGTTPMNVKNVPVGELLWTVRKGDGWPDESGTVMIASGTKAPVRAEFTYGNLTITSDPSGAEVWEKGKLLGKTPMELGEIIPGPVEFQLNSPEFLSFALKGAVKRSETTKLHGKLLPKPMGKLVIYRTYQLFGAALHHQIFVGGKTVARLYTNQKVVLSLPAGTVDIGVTARLLWRNNTAGTPEVTRTFAIQPNETLHVLTHYDNEQLALLAMPKSEAEPVVAGTKEINVNLKEK